MIDYFEKIYLTDISRNRLILGKKRYKNTKIEYILADNQNLPFKDEMFDYIISFDVLEHVPDDGKMLFELFRVIKPDGKLVLSTVNPLSPIHRALLKLGLISYRSVKKKIITPDGHLHGYSPLKLKDMLNDAGFEVMKIEGNGLAFVPFSQKIRNMGNNIFHSVEYKISGRLPDLSFYIVAFARKRIY